MGGACGGWPIPLNLNKRLRSTEVIDTSLGVKQCYKHAGGVGRCACMHACAFDLLMYVGRVHSFAICAHFLSNADCNWVSIEFFI